jgi:hypothetical protein
MSLLYDSASTQPSIHVLIVAVGCHELKLPALPMVGQTTERLVEFWRAVDVSKRTLEGQVLGSIDVLLSSSNKAQQQVLSQVERALRQNVIDALDRWTGRLRPGDVGILHWIGHGEMAGEEAAPTQYLWCEDASENRLYPKGIKWPALSQSLKNFAKTADIFCFIDTCRTTCGLSSGSLDAISALPEYKAPPASRRPTVIHAAHPGGETYGFEEAVATLDDFKGGTLFSEALIKALKSFGAARRDANVGFAAYETAITDVLDAKINQWVRRRPSSAKAAECFSGGSIVHIESSGSRAKPLLRIPMPKSTIDVPLSKKRSTGHVCKASKISPDGTVEITNDLRPYDMGWDIDVARDASGQTRILFEVKSQSGIIFNTGKKNTLEAYSNEPVQTAGTITE